MSGYHSRPTDGLGWSIQPGGGIVGDDLERVAEAVNLTYFAHVPVQPVDMLSSGTPPTPGPGQGRP